MLRLPPSLRVSVELLFYWGATVTSFGVRHSAGRDGSRVG